MYKTPFGKSVHILWQYFSIQVNRYDAEEAILYFLEQDPVIVLSVARPLQKVTEKESIFVMNVVKKKKKVSL